MTGSGEARHYTTFRPPHGQEGGDTCLSVTRGALQEVLATCSKLWCLVWGTCCPCWDDKAVMITFYLCRPVDIMQQLEPRYYQIFSYFLPHQELHLDCKSWQNYEPQRFWKERTQRGNFMTIMRLSRFSPRSHNYVEFAPFLLLRKILPAHLSFFVILKLLKLNVAKLLSWPARWTKT